jgi:hypothetical protein
MTEKTVVEEKPRRRRPPQPLPFAQRKTCTIRMASDFSGIGRSGLYRFMDAGRLKSLKVGKRRLVDVASLLELLHAADKGAAA